MLSVTKSALEKRRAFKASLKSGKLLQLPGATSPLCAKLIEQKGFEGFYISGAVLSADLGLPDIGLTTATEVTARGQQIAQASNLPALLDADTGFGEPANVGRTIQALEDAGIAGCHIEDQLMPKRCGHLDNKVLVSVEDMTQKIRAACLSRRCADFTLVARTDARGVEGLEAAIARAKAYVDAGAEAIFPDALVDEHDFEAFRKAIDVPLIANMTEFGKTKLLSREALEGLGYNVVLYPVTLLRLAMKAMEAGLETIMSTGTQAQLLPQMQHRSDLYALLNYRAYGAFDSSITNFNVGEKSPSSRS